MNKKFIIALLILTQVAAYLSWVTAKISLSNELNQLQVMKEKELRLVSMENSIKRLNQLVDCNNEKVKELIKYRDDAPIPTSLLFPCVVEVNE